MCYNLYSVARKLIQTGFFKSADMLERTHMYLDDVLSQFLTKFTKGSRMSEKESQTNLDVQWEADVPVT